MHKLQAAFIGAILGTATSAITPAIAMPISDLAGASKTLTLAEELELTQQVDQLWDDDR